MLLEIRSEPKMENGEGKLSWEIMEELENDILELQARLSDDGTKPNSNPYEDSNSKCFRNISNNHIVIPTKIEMKDIPEDMHDPSYQHALVDFKTVMHALQKTIAIEHAKKVREGKESVNMNAILRQKYGEDNYYFPDRILNAGLSKKDFTAPFLIDVKLINQDLGKTAVVKEGDESPSPKALGAQGNRIDHEKRKHEQISDDSMASNSPTLFAMLGKQEGDVKRVKISEPMKPNAPQTRQRLAQTEGSILARTLSSTIAGVKAMPNARIQQIQVSKQSPVLIRNGVGQTVVRPIAQVQGKVPVTIKPKPELTMKPKPPPLLKPMQGISLSSIAPAADKLARNPQVTITPVPAEPQDDDFAPKIVNTQGNFKAATTTPEKSVAANGLGNSQTPPKLIAQKRSADGSVKSGQVSRGSGFLGCKTCGKTFPSSCDNLFRSHMIIKHNKEVTDAEILQAKIQVSQWYKCKKCALMVLNNLEEHNRNCCPDLDFDSAFDAIQVVTDNVPKLQCGLCNEFSESRVHLRSHLDTVHPEISRKTFLDPHFRCGVCLQLFTDVAKLISHVARCESTTPSQETTQELAQKNLYCEICAKKHSKIRETLFCYQIKSLLRCVLCLHVSINRNNFFNHLKVYHNRRQGICCPFCNDDVEKKTRDAFDHFIDDHYNVALKKAGEAALVRGRIQLQAQSAASKLTGSNGSGVPRPVPTAAPPPKVMPPLRPKTVLTTTQGATNILPQTIQVPVSQFLRIGTPGVSTAHTVIGNSGLPAGTLLRPIVVPQKGIPSLQGVGITFVPTSNIQTISTPVGTTITQLDASDAIGEDSILGM